MLLRHERLVSMRKVPNNKYQRNTILWMWNFCCVATCKRGSRVSTVLFPCHEIYEQQGSNIQASQILIGYEF